MKPGYKDPNPIIDGGCLKSVGSIQAVGALCEAMGIDMVLRPLTGAPFLHGYGPKCSDAKITMAMWDLDVTDLTGTRVKIPFYVTEGDGFLLLDNEVVHGSDLMNSLNLMVIPPGVGNLSTKKLWFQTYHDSMTMEDANQRRTYLNIVPSKCSSFKSFFSSVRSFVTLQPRYKDYSDGRTAKRFARKLHGYSHLTYEDMVTLCERGGVLNPVLKQALKSVVERCTSCKSTGQPLRSSKISPWKVCLNFNDHVQMDFFFIKELTDKPIYHLADLHTAYSETSLVESRDMSVAGTFFETMRVNHHEAPRAVSGDMEFTNKKFLDCLRYFHVKIEPRPARRHNKMGVVERKHAVQ